MSDRALPAVIIFALLAAMFYALHADHLSEPATPFTYAVHNQASNARTDDKDDHGRMPETLWQKITNEPVAFTTLCLTAVTGVLAMSTIGLWLVTAREGKRHSEDMRASIAVAKRSADVAERVLTEIERALIVFRTINVSGLMRGSRQIGYALSIESINSGRTVGRRFRGTMNCVAFPGDMPINFRYPDRQQLTSGIATLARGSYRFSTSK